MQFVAHLRRVVAKLEFQDSHSGILELQALRINSSWAGGWPCNSFIYKNGLSFVHIAFGSSGAILEGLASYCKAETTFTFHFSILTLSNAFLGIDNREMKSESGVSFAIASQPF